MDLSNQMSIKTKSIIIIILLQFTLLYSQNFQLGGYSKYLFSSFNIQDATENLTEHMLHSRLNLKYFIIDDLSITAGLRNRIIYGESVEKIPDYRKKISANNYFIKLNTFVWDSKKSLNLIEIDRLYLDYSYHQIQLTAGRQRIAYGTSWAWNIVDLFNPLSILDFDYEERPASDAFRIQFFPSTTSKIDFATRFDRKIKNLTSTFQVYFNKWEYDFFFLAGYHKQRPVAGFAWSGDIMEAGFRGEFVISTPPSKLNLSNSNSFKGEKRAQLSTVISLDYTFENSFYIHSELMFNSIGKTEFIQLSNLDAIELGMLSSSKWNLFYQIGYNPSPLSRIDFIILHNPIDYSVAILPVFNYSLFENLDGSLIALITYGESFEEYSPPSKMFFVRLKYSF